MEKKFDLERWKIETGYYKTRELYDFERYKAINPKLTKKIYDFLYHNGGTWKIKCGKKVVMRYENEVLEPVWWLDTIDNYLNRYL